MNEKPSTCAHTSGVNAVDGPPEPLSVTTKKAEDSGAGTGRSPRWKRYAMPATTAITTTEAPKLLSLRRDKLRPLLIVREIPAEPVIDVDVWLERLASQPHSRFLQCLTTLSVVALAASCN